MGRLPRIPYDEIDRRGDRSWTLRLVERVRDPRASERDRWKAARTLRELDDPRMIALPQQVEDKRRAMREVGVERQDRAAAACSESLAKCIGIAGTALPENPGSMATRHRLGAVHGVRIHNDELVWVPGALEHA